MMYEYDFSNLHLPKKEYYLLRLSAVGKRKYFKFYDNLIRIDLIGYDDYSTDENGYEIPKKKVCRITEKGRCYLQYCRNNFVDNRIPIIISLIALIISLLGV